MASPSSGAMPTTWTFGPGGLRDGVGGDDLLDGRVADPLVGEVAEHGVGNAGKDALGTVFAEDFGGGHQGAGGFGHVVDQQDVAALDLADDVHGLDPGGADAVLGDDGEFGAEGIGIGAGHLDAADIGRDDGQVGGVRMALAEVADEHGLGVEVIDRDVEEPLDLRRVEVHGEHPVDAGGGEQVGDQLGGDRDARLVLAVLAGVAEKRHHGGDALGAGAARGIHHDEQLHQVVVGRRAGRLDDEDILAADVFVDLDEGLAVRERR